MEKKYLDYEGLKKLFQIVKQRDTQLESDVTFILNGMASQLEQKADKDDVCQCEPLSEDDIYDASGQDKPQAPKAEISITSPHISFDELNVDKDDFNVKIESSELIKNLIIYYEGMTPTLTSSNEGKQYDVPDMFGQTTNFFTELEDKFGKQDTSYELFFYPFNRTSADFEYENGTEFEATLHIKVITLNGTEVEKSIQLKYVVDKVDPFDKSQYSDDEIEILKANVTTQNKYKGNSTIKYFDSNGYKVNAGGYLFSGATALEVAVVDNILGSGNNRNMFTDCSNLQKIKATNWVWNNTTSLTNMFANCPKLEYIDFSNGQSTSSSISNYQGMFNGSTNVKTVVLSGCDSNSKNMIRNALNSAGCHPQYIE